jgi:hypothetical protein
VLGLFYMLLFPFLLLYQIMTQPRGPSSKAEWVRLLTLGFSASKTITNTPLFFFLVGLGFVFAKHVLCHLSYTSSAFYSGYFEDEGAGLVNYLSRLALTVILLILAFQVARITGVCH